MRIFVPDFNFQPSVFFLFELDRLHEKLGGMQIYVRKEYYKSCKVSIKPSSSKITFESLRFNKKSLYLNCAARAAA